MDYIKLCAEADMAGRRIKSFAVLGRKIALVRSASGELFATEIQCKHQGADLSLGALSGNRVTCPRHGWTYDLETGHCLNRPSSPLRRYAMKVEEGFIFVSVQPVEGG